MMCKNTIVFMNHTPKTFSSTLAHFSERFTSRMIVALSFLLPITLLPFTIESREINKQTLLVVFVGFAFLAFLGQIVQRRTCTLKKGLVQILPLLFLVSTIVSSLLSTATWTSFVGQDSQEYLSLLSLLGFLGLGFLIINQPDTASQKTPLTAFLSGATTVALLLILQTIHLPFLGFLGNSALSNTVGTVNTAILFLTVATILSSGLWLISEKESAGNRRFRQALTVILTSCTALLLLATDNNLLWMILLIGMISLLSLSLLRAKDFVGTGRFALPMSLTVIAIMFLFLPSPLHLGLPVEVVPSQAVSWQIATDTLHNNTPAFGTGPGTYQQNYIAFRPQEINQTTFWSTSFDRASSHILTLLPTIGWVGTICFVLFLLVLCLQTLNHLITEKQSKEWHRIFVLFSAWLPLTVALFFYTSNLTLLFTFWMLSALIAGNILHQTTTITFSRSPRTGLSLSFVFVLSAVVVVTGLFVTSQRYAAEIAFAQGVALDRQGAEADPIIAKFNTAATYNRLSDIYFRGLSQALLLKVETAVQNPVSPEQAQDLLQLISQSITAAKTATELAPKTAANWNILGALYREIAVVDQKAEAFAIDAFNRAHLLDPQNPVPLTEIGKCAMTFAQNSQTNAVKNNTAVDQQAIDAYIARAEEALNQAIALKSDYGPAHYQLALVYEQQGRLADAIAKLETVKPYNPLDVGIAFQLGLLYLRQGKNDLAEAELYRTVQLEPGHANAHWFLATIYEQKGEISNAIEHVQKVLELNPDNQLVKAKLERLQAGQISSVIPEPVENTDQNVANTTPQP